MRLNLYWFQPWAPDVALPLKGVILNLCVTV